jgi:FtsP/CotA-like multicopper oxidase with cupredoxin domain
MQSRTLSLALAGAAVAVAVVLFILLSDGGDSDSGTAANRKPAGNGKPAGNREPAATSISFKDGAPVGGVRDIEVTSGDPVRITVTPDVPALVHVHGYELEKEMKAGETAKLDFPAQIEGEFEVEVHELVNGEEQEGIHVATLTVTP